MVRRYSVDEMQMFTRLRCSQQHTQFSEPLLQIIDKGPSLRTLHDGAQIFIRS